MASTVGSFDIPSGSNDVTTTSDANSAAVSTVNNVTVDIPKSASASVTMSANGQTIGIDMPNASGTQTGTVTAPGIVAYPTSNGNVANAVQADEGGAARFLTVIKDANAPEEYEYNLHLPAGSSIEKQDDGSLKVAVPNGEGYVIGAPWAHDANGAHVWTQWFTDGESTIDLVVNHHGESLAYPLTADPWISYGWTGMTYNFSLNETKNIVAYGSIIIAPALGGATAAAVASGALWYANYGSKRHMCLSYWRPYWSVWGYAYVRYC
ncbi:hypothetical protein [Streptomyces chartreusis]|uniref:Uncharacterized protein n=1 Tax=Streptomyces chartreusis TaxID=1969 RepID=A0A7H8TIJ9_STRCX|nr:hypothetical protein [Streptomyces chartreusis]QKZ22868.1 hypothetical protein HUT05_39285 [Streptomyces chartreusis]